jgi:hypothetical protein
MAQMPGFGHRGMLAGACGVQAGGGVENIWIVRGAHDARWSGIVKNGN